LPSFEAETAIVTASALKSGGIPLDLSVRPRGGEGVCIIIPHVRKEISSRFERQEADQVEFDVNRHARGFGAVTIIRFEFDFSDTGLIVKHSIAAAVGGRGNCKLRKLKRRQFLQAPRSVVLGAN
jgi:hypothetical protein